MPKKVYDVQKCIFNLDRKLHDRLVKVSVSKDRTLTWLLNDAVKGYLDNQYPVGTYEGNDRKPARRSAIKFDKKALNSLTKRQIARRGAQR